MRIRVLSRALNSKIALCNLFLFLLCCLVFTGESSAKEVISIQTYHERISESIQYLESRQGKLTQEDALFLKKNFSKRLNIECGTKDQVLLDYHGIHHWIQKAINKKNGKKQLIVHLKNLLSQTPVGKEKLLDTLTWEESQRHLNDVFSEKEFRYLDDKTRPNWLAYLTKILQSIRKWLKSNFHPPRWIQGTWVEYIIYGLYVVVLIFGFLLILRIVRAFGPTGWRWKEPRFMMKPEKKAPQKDWRKWRDAARKEAEVGAYRNGIRCLVLSVRMEAHQMGWWIYKPETTNMEHLAGVQGPDSRLNALNKLTRLHERTWYGLKQPGKAQFEESINWIQQMGCTL